MERTKIGFLGLGVMGSRMAARLLAAGYPLSVYNRTAEKAQPLVEGGAMLAKSPAEAAAGAEIVFSILADDRSCREVWLGRDGALAGARPGTILVESSTVSVEWIRTLDSSARARGCELLDAPVTGSKPQAAAGELRFLAGGSEVTLTRISPVLKAMGRVIAYMGPLGSGVRMKLINNFMCGVQAACLAEVLSLIERSNLDVRSALAIVTGGAPGSPIVKTLSGRMLAPEDQPHFLLKLMAKDLRFAIEEAKHYSLHLTTGEAALEVFGRAIESGFGEHDIAAVVEPFRAQKQPHSSN
jgi:3-hydroxyisobutyrate dehydrogenase